MQLVASGELLPESEKVVSLWSFLHVSDLELRMPVVHNVDDLIKVGLGATHFDCCNFGLMGDIIAKGQSSWKGPGHELFTMLIGENPLRLVHVSFIILTLKPSLCVSFITIIIKPALIIFWVIIKIL